MLNILGSTEPHGVSEMKLETFLMLYLCFGYIKFALFFFPSTASGWFLEKVEITDADGNSMHCFNCNRSVDQSIITLYMLFSFSEVSQLLLSGFLRQ